MGRRGPAPKPTKLKLVAGERKDRINSDEPIPAERKVRPPSWLTADAKKVWREYAGDLERVGVLTPWDIEAFANWCDAVVRRREAAAKLDEHGTVIEIPVFNKNGERTGERMGRSPWHQVWKDADEQVRRYAARFGLTPSDRSQIKRPGESKKRPAERLLT